MTLPHLRRPPRRWRLGWMRGNVTVPAPDPDRAVSSLLTVRPRLLVCGRSGPGSRHRAGSPSQPAPCTGGWGSCLGVPPASLSGFSPLPSAHARPLVPCRRVHLGNICSGPRRRRRNKECGPHFRGLFTVRAEGMGNAEPCSCLPRSRPLLMTVLQGWHSAPGRKT